MYQTYLSSAEADDVSGRAFFGIIPDFLLQAGAGAESLPAHDKTPWTFWGAVASAAALSLPAWLGVAMLFAN